MSAFGSSPFLLRTAEPSIEEVEGRKVVELRRIGKRIAIGIEGDDWLVLHLMIAGRLHWRQRGAKLGGRQNLVAFDFPDGSLVLTEAGSKRRASLHLLRGEDALKSMDPGGIEIFSSDVNSFVRRSLQKIARSSALSRIHTSSVASAMLIRMKFCTQRNCLRSRARKN